jgi:hypothetical protein
VNSSRKQALCQCPLSDLRRPNNYQGNFPIIGVNNTLLKLLVGYSQAELT